MALAEWSMSPLRAIYYNLFIFNVFEIITWAYNYRNFVYSLYRVIIAIQIRYENL